MRITVQSSECAVEGEAGDLELAEGEGEGAAGIGFLDAAGQRALAADAEAVGVGEVGAGERAGGKDQRVVRPQRIDLGRALFQQRLGDEMPAELADDRLALQLLGLDGLDR